MPDIKIFLASSKELESDRKEFDKFINKEKNRWTEKNLSFKLIIWEDFPEAMSQTRLQDEYNKAIREADIFVMLFFTKVGQYTREEFELAFGEFKEKNRPFVYTYFKDAPINTGALSNEVKSLLEFKERLIELGHFHSTYTNTHELLLKFSDQLDKLFPAGEKPANPSKETRLLRELTTIPKPDDEVIGRQEDIVDLEKLLGHSQKVVLMNGLGGIGKTTLAKQFVQLHKSKYDHIAWIDVKSRDSGSDTDMTTTEAFVYNEVLIKNLRLSFTNEAVPEKFKMIVNALSNIPGKNLLVIDNAREDLNDREVKNILPGPPQWKILVTSRQKFSGFDLFEIEHLTPSHAKELFRVHFKKTAEEKDIEELLKEVSYHTLTIELLAKTFGYPGQALGFQEVISRLRSRQLSSPTLQRKIELAHNREETDIYIHLIQTFDLSVLTDYEKWLMKQFAFLLPRYYFVAELENFLDITEEAAQKELQEALHNLDKKGWLKYTGEGYGVHRMVQQMVHYQLEPGLKDIEKLIQKFNQLLKFDASTDFTRLFFLIPCAEGILKQLKSDDLTTSAISSLQNNLGVVIKHSGDYEKARDLHEAAMQTALKNLGERHPTIAVHRSNLADVYRNLGDYEKARNLLETALQSDLDNFGEQHHAVAVSRSNLANVYDHLGDYKKARDLLETALESDLKNFGEQHSTVAVRRSNLAIVYQNLSDYEKARDLLEKALESGLKNLGEQHSSVAVIRSNLANVYRHLGEYKKARDSGEKALESDLKNFGELHPLVAIRFNNLAWVYFGLKDLTKARDYFEKAISIFIKTVGPNHPNTKGTIKSLETVKKKMAE